MARNGTTFQSGHKQLPGAGFQKGNTLPVKHGALSPRLVDERVALISTRIDEELAQLPYLTVPDSSLVRAYKRITAQAELWGEYWDKVDMFTTRGVPKKGVRDYLLLVDRQMKMAEVLGLGAVPRAKVARDLAGAGRDHAEVRAAQERLRARQERPKVIDGSR